MTKENQALTHAQDAFCHYAVSLSWNEAYRRAYPAQAGGVISGDVQRLKNDPRVSRRIAELRAEARKPIKLDAQWFVDFWMARATYNPDDLTRWTVMCCRHCHGDGFGYQWREHEYMMALEKAEQDKTPLPDIGGGFGFNTKLPPRDDCPACNGRGEGRTDFTDTMELSDAARLAFDGVEQTKDGIRIKMADRGEAAIQLAKITGFDVKQIRLTTDEVPDAERLAELARDPNAIAQAYKRFCGLTG